MDFMEYYYKHRKATDLHNAISEKNLDKVDELLLKSDTDLEAKDVKGMTPIILAAKVGDLDIFNRMLKCERVSLESTDDDKMTALHHACKAGQLAILDRLLSLDEGVDVMVKGHNAFTPLHTAAGSGQVHVVDRLLAHPKVDPSVGESGGRSPLQIAAFEGKVGVVDRLLADVDPSQADRFLQTAVHAATKRGHLDVVSRLSKDARADALSVSKEGTPLDFAIEMKRFDILDVLLQFEQNKPSFRNKESWSLLHYAVRYGLECALEFLLNRGDIDADWRDNRGRSALHFAAEYNHAAIVDRLLQLEGIDTLCRDKENKSPLHLAAMHNSAEALTRMFEEGDVDPACQDKDNCTPLDYVLASAKDLCSASTRSMLASLTPFEQVQVTVSNFERILELHRNNDGRLTGDEQLDDIIMLKYLSRNVGFKKMSNFKEVQQLSSGNFGDTYCSKMVLEQDIKFPVVLKVAKAETGSDEWLELQALQNIPRSPYVLPLLGLCSDFALGEEIAKTALVIPFLNGGSLRDHLDEHSLSPSRMLDFACDMARGVSHMHVHGYKHNDIAARNFLLLRKEQGDTANQRLVICDFGLTREVSFVSKTHALLPWRWTAPEVMGTTPGKDTTRSDVWMLGIAFWELLGANSTPFPQFRRAAQLIDEYKKGRVPLYFPKATDEDFKQLILDCCSLKSEDRPTADEVLRRLQQLKLRQPVELAQIAREHEDDETTLEVSSDDDYEEQTYLDYSELSDGESSASEDEDNYDTMVADDSYAEGPQKDSAKNNDNDTQIAALWKEIQRATSEPFEVKSGAANESTARLKWLLRDALSAIEKVKTEMKRN